MALSDWNGPLLLLVTVTRHAVAGNLAVGNCRALEAPTGLNVLDRPPMGGPGALIHLSQGASALRLWLGSLGTASGPWGAAPSWGEALPGWSPVVGRSRSYCAAPSGRLAHKHKVWPTRPGPRTAKHFAWKILACLQLREEGVLETAGAGESVQCWPNLEGTSAKRGCVLLEKKFTLCPQLLNNP